MIYRRNRDRERKGEKNLRVREREREEMQREREGGEREREGRGRMEYRGWREKAMREDEKILMRKNNCNYYNLSALIICNYKI